MTRLGMTVPFEETALHAQRDGIAELAERAYTDVWSSETSGADAFTPLVLASQWAPTLRLGTAIVPAFTRGPAVLAQSVGALAQAAPGRVTIGIGTSSDVIVGRWNGIAFEKPYQRVRDTVRFLREALTGQKVTRTYETFSISGFKLTAVPEDPVPILVAALRPGMLRLAGSEGDGAIVNWLSADDVLKVAPYVRKGHGDKEIVARIMVAPTSDRERVLELGRTLIAAYLNVPVYAAFHDWLGRADQLGSMWEAWRAGDRKAALAAIPDGIVDELFVHGTPDECRAHIQRYVDNGVDTPVIALLPVGVDSRKAARELGAERH
jgi:probable F420-dependent oxidoreductase